MIKDANILVVDDDQVLCNLLDRYLTTAGFHVKTAMDGGQMHKCLKQRLPDLVILDLNLPDSHGLELARELRKTSDIGIIILTGNDDAVDKVVGLEVGADDYISKPFNDRELVARIRSVLRRTSSIAHQEDVQEKKRAVFSDWTLDLVAHELSDPDGELVDLTSYEFQLLSAFVTHPNRVLSRDQLMEYIAGRDWSPTDRSVDVLVGKLRKKIDDKSGGGSMIKTIRGAGYKLTVEVRWDTA